MAPDDTRAVSTVRSSRHHLGPGDGQNGVVLRWLLSVLLLILSACSSGGPKAASPASTIPASTVPPASSVAPTSASTGAPPSTARSNTAASTTTAPHASTVSSAAPCLGAAPPATYQHVVIILMENRAESQVQGSSQAPYVNHLGAQCGVATNYAGISHPSLPNYIALTSGSTQGISDDNDPSSHHLSAPSIFSLLGGGWRSLEENIPSPCYQTNSGQYAVRHNPAAYYVNISAQCRTQDVAMDDAAPDISARYTFITPNVCNDGHDCSTATADRWMSVEVPRILNTAEYRSGSTALFITWDENDSGGSLVPTYVVAPSVVAGTRVSSPLNHYSLLRTSEELLGLTPLLGAAAGAPSMRGPFHL